MSEAIAERKPLPSGTVTFLFSDIEGSTERWERHRAGMKGAVERHDEIMHAAISAHDGHVFKTVGDAFCAAFHTVPDAIGAALDAQRRLREGDFAAVDGLDVRIAIHTGLAHERGGDYFGPTVNRVARLLSIGHGGQVLVSGAAADLALGEMPAHAALRDLGEHRLKDLTYPQQVYQLIGADLPAEFPPLRSLDALPNNLPLQVTSFIGRDKDVADVKELLDRTHLLTLAGPGGVGKTRLALQVGADLLDRYPNGVWVVELGDLTDPDLIPSEIASVLGIGGSSDRSLSESIVAALKPRRTLIILDNCEHLLRPVAGLVSSIIRSCPNVRIMATSREVFAAAGEVVYRVASLDLAPVSEVLTAADALAHGAVALFVDRAIAANSRFELTDADAPIVADICRRLDGIAFAIELAAARAKVMSVASLAERLNQRFRILTGGDRTGLQRQQTMRALIDWSYNLLTAAERKLLNRVAIFAGGWTAEAAEQIGSGGDGESWEVLDLITSLVDKSLVVPDLKATGDRYRLLESTREYALERLTESGERDHVARAHAEFFLDLARKADKNWHSTSTQAWLATLEPELDNFRAALEWTLSQQNDRQAGAAMVNALGHLWYDGGLYQEGRGWVHSALTAVGDGADVRLEASLWLSLSQLSDARERLQTAERARALYAAVAEEVGVARAQRQLAYGLYQLGRFAEAEDTCNAAMPVLRRSGDARETADCIARLGSILWAVGRNEDALQLFNEALGQAKRLGYDELVGAIQTNMAETKFSQGDVAAAIAHAGGALASDLRLKNPRNVAIDYANICAYQVSLDDFDEARASARQAMRYAREAQLSGQIATIIQHLATIDAAAGDASRAARLIGFVDAAFAANDVHREPTEAAEYDRMMGLLRHRLTNDEFAALMAEGAVLPEEQAIEEALSV